MIKKFQYKPGLAQILLSVLIWIMIFAMPILFTETDNGINWTHILKVWGEYCFVFAIYLVNRFILLPLLFFKGKRAQYFTYISIIIIGFAAILFLFSERGKPMQKPPPHIIHQEFRDGRPPMLPPPMHVKPKGEIIPPYANLLILTILILGFDTGLMFYAKWFESEQKQLRLQKENTENKMAFLQNQISPHFFMNTLNNIHALMDIDTEDAKNAIIRLSQLMGYMLYESQTEKISLQKEMDFVRSYVDLMKLRYTNDIDVKLNIPDTIPQKNIPPLLTISYIENAFKHGVSYQQPSFIHINYTFEDKELYFSCINSRHHDKSKIETAGIGLENSISRLDLIYGEDFQLKIDERKDYYQVDLITPL